MNLHLDFVPEEYFYLLSNVPTIYMGETSSPFLSTIASLIPICPLLWQRDVKLQQTKPCACLAQFSLNNVYKGGLKQQLYFHGYLHNVWVFKWYFFQSDYEKLRMTHDSKMKEAELELKNRLEQLAIDLDCRWKDTLRLV